MFTDHGSFIIGCSAAKHHLAIAPESAAILRFADAVAAAGYTCTPNLIRVPWTSPIDYALLEQLIAFDLRDKADCLSFRRKA